MSFEEFLASAEEQQRRGLDKDLWRQLRSLFVEGGSLRQLVAALLEQQQDLKDMLANNQMVDEASIRKAIGLQGQILGINNNLAAIHQLMLEPPNPDEADHVA